MILKILVEAYIAIHQIEIIDRQTPNWNMIMTTPLNYTPNQTLADTLEGMGKTGYVSNYSDIRYRAHLGQAIMVAKLARSVTFPVRLLVRLVGKWLKRSKLRAELEALDDNMLADVGITRSDINAIVSSDDYRPESNEIPENLMFFKNLAIVKRDTASDEAAKTATGQRNAA